MADLTKFNINAVCNRNNNIFGLPFTEEDAQVILLPVPWEVTVSCSDGTARCAEHIFKASMHIDLFDRYVPDGWKKGFFMREADKKVLMKSDYLRKEAELYIDFIAHDHEINNNKFMLKSLKEINEGSVVMNKWVYEQTKDILSKNKFVGLIGGDHSVSLGYLKALAEKHSSFGILQIDAHCDLRKAYENLDYSHASIMYNALNEISAIEKLIQVGIRDFCEEEWNYICNSNYKVIAYFDEAIKEREYNGESWKHITDEIVDQLPDNVYISFDIDGLDPKLCPNTGTPVPGGFNIEQMVYLFKTIVESGRKIIGFDIVEVGVGDTGYDALVASRLLWKMCNLLVKSQSKNASLSGSVQEKINN